MGWRKQPLIIPVRTGGYDGFETQPSGMGRWRISSRTRPLIAKLFITITLHLAYGMNAKRARFAASGEDIWIQTRDLQLTSSDSCGASSAVASETTSAISLTFFRLRFNDGDWGVSAKQDPFSGHGDNLVGHPGHSAVRRNARR